LERNLLRRVETCFPLLDPEVAARVKEEGLDNYLADNLNAWELQADGRYRRREPADGEPPRSAQPALLAKICRRWTDSAAPARWPRRCATATCWPPSTWAPTASTWWWPATPWASCASSTACANRCAWPRAWTPRAGWTARCASARWPAWRASASASATSRRSAYAPWPPTRCACWPRRSRS